MEYRGKPQDLIETRAMDLRKGDAFGFGELNQTRKALIKSVLIVEPKKVGNDQVVLNWRHFDVRIEGENRVKVKNSTPVYRTLRTHERRIQSGQGQKQY